MVVPLSVIEAACTCSSRHTCYTSHTCGTGWRDARLIGGVEGPVGIIVADSPVRADRRRVVVPLSIIEAACGGLPQCRHLIKEGGDAGIIRIRYQQVVQKGECLIIESRINIALDKGKCIEFLLGKFLRTEFCVRRSIPGSGQLLDEESPSCSAAKPQKQGNEDEEPYGEFLFLFFFCVFSVRLITGACGRLRRNVRDNVRSSARNSVRGYVRDNVRGNARGSAPAACASRQACQPFTGGLA